MPMAQRSSDAIISAGHSGHSRAHEGGRTMPIDDKLFGSEVRRMDSDISNVKKSQEKFETKTEKSIDAPRRDIHDLRQETRSQTDRLDARFWWLMGAVTVSILV